MKPAEKRMRTRTILVTVAVGLWFGAIGAKAAYLQIFRQSWLSQKAAHQVTSSTEREGKRGSIYDAGLRELAVSVDVQSVAAYPSRIPDPAAAAQALAPVLSLDRRQLYKKLRLDRPFVWIKRKANPKETRAIQDLKITGIDFVPEHNRYYPNTTMASQLIGFSGVDGSGLEGLEYYYNNVLKGGRQHTTMFKDALGRGFETAEGDMRLRSGDNLVLTIDRGVQFIAEKVLSETVAKYGAASGIAIVMVPRTGAILALAHVPFFNPNAFGGFDRNKWRNRAITDPYEPGSTLKVFTASAALASGQVTPKSVFYCEKGRYRIGSNVIHDVKEQEWLTLADIVRFSSNIGAAKVAEMIGPERLYETLQAFGFGERTGIDCPGESSGTLAPWQRWSKMDLCAIAFGQGISVTALQLVRAVAAVANDGVVMEPFVVQAVTDFNGRLIRRREPKIVRRALSPDVARQVREILTGVVSEDGSGALAALEGYSAGGKTGTAQKADEKGSYAEGRFVASFVGFAPAQRPEIAVLVMVDEPTKSHYGGIVAAPAFKKIAEETLNYLNVPPAEGGDRMRVSAGSEVTG